MHIWLFMSSFTSESTITAVAVALFTSLVHAAPAPTTGPLGQVKALTAQEELKTIHLQDGYQLELVLDDEQIKEPVLCVFDGNGRMYVAEMRTYMQDIDGTGQFEPTSRISRHESSKGDGVFDKHSVYLDGLVLPRMVLPLDDRVLVNVTNTSDITIHRDANGDGKSDSSAIWFDGGKRGGNLEHQPSGLVWGLDNGIYTTYNNYRLRWNGTGNPIKETTAIGGGQWGLAQDNYGKMWWSNAGGEKGIWNFQVPILYAAINVPDQKPANFDTVWPIVALGDFQGGTKRFHSPRNRSLNRFTASCGQTVFRGDRLPQDLVGNVFLPEPVGRLIRRATVTLDDGITKVANPYGHDEFIRSTDPNFRPINMTTGPDGCIYIVDMYRGIIQEGAWTRKGSFLRQRLMENGMQNVTGHGRIWRLVHKDFKPGPQPRMLGETPAQWVAHLSHPNGWWRDTAQRMLIVKGDKSVVPALVNMVKSDPNPLARIHAIWTLEGLGALTPEIAMEMLASPDPHQRAQGIRVSESLLKSDSPHPQLLAKVNALASDKDPSVQLQVMMTSKHLNWPDWKYKAKATIAATSSKGVREIGNKLVAGGVQLTKGNFDENQYASLKRGEAIYSSLCFACHGSDGKGMPMAGSKTDTLAPPLGGSHTVRTGDSLLRVLLHGLSGPIDGKTYESQMMAMGNNSDQWIADVSGYVRNAFGNRGTIPTGNEVKALRASTANRTETWTIAEMASLQPRVIDSQSSWKLTSSHNSAGTSNALDHKSSTRWSSSATQQPGMWVMLELPAAEPIEGVVLETEQFPYRLPARLHGGAFERRQKLGNSRRQRQRRGRQR